MRIDELGSVCPGGVSGGLPGKVAVQDSCFFFFSSRRRHTRLQGDWSSDVCSSDLAGKTAEPAPRVERVAGHATAGEHRLKVTFAGGTWPTIGTAKVPDDWQPWATLDRKSVV